MQRDLLQVRRENLKALLQKYGGPSSLAQRLQFCGRSYLSQLATGVREVSEKTARKIEQALGLEQFALDQVPGEQLPFANSDRALLAASVRAVGEELERAKAKLSSQKFAELVSLAYERAVNRGAVDLEYIRQLIQLAN